jgi:polygalacturonase
MATFNIADFGAVGDGKTLATAAINATIKRCAEAGGGQVTIAAGHYLSGSIHMQSGVTLFLEAGARITGTADLEQYLVPVYRGKLSKWHRALILLEDVQDVRICGHGVIDGHKVFDPEGEEKMRGPHAVCALNSKDIQIHDVNFVDAANYAMFFGSCDNIDVNNVTVKGGWDGVHVRGTAKRHSQRVTVTNSRFFTGDDCFAGAYTDDILVNNCLLNTACNGVRWIGPGSGMLFSNCTIFGGSRHPHRTTGRMHSLAGITIQPGAWGAMPGILDDIRIHNITMHKVGSPLWLLVKEGGSIGRVDISNVTASATQIGAVTMESWVDNPIEAITLRNCDFSYDSEPVIAVTHALATFPSFDIRPVPAWGMYAKNIRTLHMDNVRFLGTAEDKRPVLIAEGIEKLTRRDVRVGIPVQDSQTVYDRDVAVLRWP